MKQLECTIIALLFCCSAFTQEKSQADTAAVRQACFNYIDAFYKADTSLAHASIHPSLQKRGFFYDKNKTAYSTQLEMPFRALVRLATTWNKDGSRANAQSPRDVRLFEVADKTASAKVTAAWGIDYLHLMKENGRWYIVNVLWQSPPLSAARL